MAELRILDLHCHPGFKNWLFPHLNHLWKKGPPNSDFSNNCVNQIDMPSLKTGLFRGLISAHYLPEKNLLDKNFATSIFRNLVPELVTPQYDTFEMTNPFAQVRMMMEHFEEEVAGAAAHNFNAALAKSLAEFNNHWNIAAGTDKMIFVHSLEGAHCLGRNLARIDDYMIHLKIFHQKGACMMTLAHFFPNDIATGVEGIAPSFRKLVLKKEFVPDNDAPLTAAGEQIVKEMFSMGMIVDLTHSTYPARDRVFQLNRERGMNQRPVILSHTGVKTLFRPISPGSIYKFDQYAARTEDISAVKSCDGVIGIVMENYWLCGIEENSDPASAIGLQHVIDTINEIHRQTGSFKNISLGTDYDGYIDAPDDLIDSSQMFKLIDLLQQQTNMTTTDIEDILCGNAKRVLQNGWS